MSGKRAGRRPRRASCAPRARRTTWSPRRYTRRWRAGLPPRSRARLEPIPELSEPRTEVRGSPTSGIGSTVQATAQTAFQPGCDRRSSLGPQAAGGAGAFRRRRACIGHPAMSSRPAARQGFDELVPWTSFHRRAILRRANATRQPESRTNDLAACVLAVRRGVAGVDDEFRVVHDHLGVVG